MSVLLSCVTFRRLSVVISSIDGYVAVFVLYADSQTYTQAHSESQWHVLPLQHLIFHISLSLSLFYIFAARLTCFLCCAVSVSFCCPCSHQLVVLPSPPHPPPPPPPPSGFALPTVLLCARVTCVDLLSNLPGLSVIPQQ